MKEISSPNAIRTLLEKFSHTPNKALGQNFFADDAMLERIIDCSGITPQSTVLEIGAGLGALSVKLAARAARVVTVELDKALLPILEYTLEGVRNVRVVNADILKLNHDMLFGLLGAEYDVVANIPYAITSELIEKLLVQEGGAKRISLLVQLEAAKRLNARPGTKQYGALSALAQCVSDVQLCFSVPPSCFYPQPEVDSALLRLDTHRERTADMAYLARTIKASFAMRRKTLANNLAAAFALTKAQVEQILTRLNIESPIRAEALAPEVFERLAQELYRLMKK